MVFFPKFITPVYSLKKNNNKTQNKQTKKPQRNPNCGIAFKTVKVRRNKGSVTSCHSQKEPKET